MSDTPPPDPANSVQAATVPAHVAANRRNAKRSTGPRTPSGKEIAARNAMKHGLRARELVLYDESVEAYEAFVDELNLALEPGDEFEEHIVERIALCAWRLKRAGRIEAAVINDIAQGSPFGNRKVELSSPFIHRDDTIRTIARYETTLDRALERAHRLLERHRKARCDAAGAAAAGPGGARRET